MSIFDFILNSDLSEEAQEKHDQAREQLRKGNLKKARELLEAALEIEGEHRDLTELGKDIELAKLKISNISDHFNNDDPWVILFFEDFNLEQVRKHTEGEYLVEQVAVANGYWYIVLRHKTKKDAHQTYLNIEIVDDNTFNEYIQDGYTIKAFGYDHKEWFFVFEQRPQVRNQAWTYSPGEFPKKELKDWESTNGHIEHLVDMYGDFFTLATFPNRLNDYKIEYFKEFPEEEIDDYWVNETFIDYISFVKGKYILFTCKNTRLSNQGYYLDSEFPGRYVLEKMKAGCEIRQLSFFNDQWIVIYDEKAPPMAKKMTISDSEEQREMIEEVEADLKNFSHPINQTELDKALGELNSLVGLSNVKREIKSLVDYVKISDLKNEQGFERIDLNIHMAFSGSPGTGKTTVARLIGKIFLALGILDKGHVVETDRSGLVAEYIGKTALKTKEKIEESLGGVLFIDEAYALHNNSENDFGHEAIETLLKAMEDKRDQFCVILAGYTDEMTDLLESNPGLQSRIGTHLVFPDFTGAELMSILKKMLLKSNHQLSIQAEEKAQPYLQYLSDTADRHFGNGREIRNLFEDLLKNQSSRLAKLSLDQEEGSAPLKLEQLQTIELEDLRNAYQFKYEEQETESLDDILAELNELVGMQNIKQEIERLANFLSIQKKRSSKGWNSDRPTLHAVFLGPPGTGKTTVARLLARVFKALDFLKKEKVVEVSRADLVAGYVGQTALKTNKVIDKAMHGILFIDEAYALLPHSENDFGQEAVATLLKRMEDERENLVVIVAGYQNEMIRFLNSNPGLESRFSRKFYFNPFSAQELKAIFLLMVKKSFYTIPDMALPKLEEIIEEVVHDQNPNFGNARWVRTFFEQCKMEQASRINSQSFIDEPSLQTIVETDLDNAYKTMRRENVVKHHREKNKLGFGRVKP